MKCSQHRHAAAAVVLVGASLLAGCAAPPPEAEEPPPAGLPVPPCRDDPEVMNSVIHPSVDVVWNSVKTVNDNGTTDHAPAADEEWAEVRRHALIVSEAANLLLMPDCPVAPPGAPSLAPGVELAPEEIRSLIDKNRDGWNFYVQQLQDSVKPALAAIDARIPRRCSTPGSDRHDVRELPSGVLVSEGRGIGSLTRIRMGF